MQPNYPPQQQYAQAPPPQGYAPYYGPPGSHGPPQQQQQPYYGPPGSAGALLQYPPQQGGH